MKMIEPEKVAQNEKSVPTADGPAGLSILKGVARDRSLLTAMGAMQREIGNIFQITMPRFQPVVVAGPDLNRQVLVTERDKFSWRGETDPVVKLLRHGILVEDGEEHDRLRGCMEPAMRRTPSLQHIPAMIRYTDQVLDSWPNDGEVDMLVEMRKVALLILLGTLYGTNFTPDLAELWKPILKAIQYISPGPWILWPNMPRPGYKADLEKLDDYLYALISRRREDGGPQDDLLGRLLNAPDMDDGLIRDQLLTMLIAGHDTSTALLAWVLYLLGEHQEVMAQVEDELGVQRLEGGIREAVDFSEDSAGMEKTLNRLTFLDMVIKETLRLFPPIHVGNRFAKEDLDLQGYMVPEETRVMVSIYLSHRDEAVWEEPEQFCPHRFDRYQKDASAEPDKQRPPLAYIPFGGGPRNCIGATFAQIESKVVLARILQQFELKLSPGQKVRPYMGATLEPRPGVKMIVKRRIGNGEQ
jgi:cytochrome P450